MARADARSRLVGARGHLDAVVRMIDDDVYCIDVLHQLSAVSGALESARRELLDGHLRTCVTSAFAEGDVDRVVDELTGALFGRRPPSGGPRRLCRHHPASPVETGEASSIDAREVAP